MRKSTLAAGVLILSVVVIARLVDEGEVVRLTTFDAEGSASVSGLWVVDINGSTYLRAGSPTARWLEHIRSRPEVAVERAGVTHKARARVLEDVALAAAVNEAMRAKYGFLDAVLVSAIDHSRCVPVRIELSASLGSGKQPPRGDES